MHEYWDLYDTDRNPLGRTHQRGLPLEEGTYHVVVAVWTLNAEGKLLLTLRSAEKELYPNLWENTSGSVLSGEESRTAALRELSEETGIVVTEEQLHFLGTARKAASFVDIYLVRLNHNQDTIRLQEGETTDYQWVEPHQLDRMMAEGLLAFPLSYQFNRFRSELGLPVLS
jgi:8-oxo-dGTP diphosphatase